MTLSITTPTTDRLGCRSVLEIVENRKSALRRSSPQAQRLAVWKEIFSADSVFFQKMAAAVDLGACGAVRGCLVSSDLRVWIDSLQ
jgi:hypothetical protein